MGLSDEELVEARATITRALGEDLLRLAALRHERVAALEIVRGGVHLEFTTRNTLSPPSQILMELVRGPFTRLIGRWRFEPIGEQGSRVGFHVEFEFKSRLMGIALNPVFESVCDKIVDSFVVIAAATAFVMIILVTRRAAPPHPAGHIPFFAPRKEGSAP